MKIKCEYWRESTEFFRGKCLTGKYGGRPVFGQCVFECKHCKTTKDELTEYMAKLAAEQNKEQAEAIQIQKAEYEKIIAELPSRALQFDSLRKHAVEIAKYKRETGRVFVSDEWKAERLKLGCEECDKLRVNPKTGKWWCGCCGCNVVGLVGDKIGKADFEALTCGPWKEIDAAFLAKLESDSEDKAAELKGV